MCNKKNSIKNRSNWHIGMVKIKKESCYYASQKYLFWILVGTIILLTMMLLVEFDILRIMLSHKIFVVNVLCGMFASGILLLAVFHIPIFINKKQNILGIKKQACKVFFEYDKLMIKLKVCPDDIINDIQLISYIDKCKNKEPSELINDKMLIISPKSIDKILIDIRRFRKMLEDSPFISESVNELADTIENKIFFSLELIYQLIDYIPEHIEKIKQLNSKFDRYMELLCKCYNLVFDIADKYYPYIEIMDTFRIVINEVGFSVNSRIASNDDLIKAFKITAQDIMIQHAKKEFSDLIVLNTNDIIKQFND